MTGTGSYRPATAEAIHKEFSELFSYVPAIDKPAEESGENDKKINADLIFSFKYRTEDKSGRNKPDCQCSSINRTICNDLLQKPGIFDETGYYTGKQREAFS